MLVNPLAWRDLHVVKYDDTREGWWIGSRRTC